jgi:DeoD family purine-nucleoside phosphorylase
VSHIVPAVPGTPKRAPIHLKPSAPVAERVLVPGDPHRALQVAQHLLERPRMLNHRRGLWGYTGAAADGAALSVQSTGIGGPSTAIVVEELIGLGARRLVRIGTCGALDPALALGALIVADRALAADGASAALGASEQVGADEGLSRALEQEAGARGALVATADLFYDPRRGIASGWRGQGAVAVEMEAAPLFRLAELRGVRAACLLVVTDLLDPDAEVVAVERRERLDDEAIESAGLRLGEVAAVARGADGRAEAS